MSHRTDRPPPVTSAAVPDAPDPSASRPSRRRRLWEGWKRFGKKAGDFQCRLLLSVFYFAVMSPFALGVRLGADPLAIKPRTSKGWRERPPAPPLTAQRAQEQY
jgi:hypothetical protein